MITVRQIERLWSTRSYRKLSEELAAARAEGGFSIEATDRPCFVAALSMVRLDELSQSHLPFYAKLLQAVLAAQDADGGWQDPACTAMCLRALLLGHGDGAAIERGFEYLARLQKDEGAWPIGPIRRMPAEASATLFILYELGDVPRFRQAVRFSDALGWFSAQLKSLGRACQEQWEWVGLKCRVNSTPAVRTPQAELFAA